jgi:hypothetical protein
MIYSIALPILLLNLAVPETKGKSLLGPGKAAVTVFVLGLDVLVLFVFVHLGSHFWMGWPVFLGSWVAIAALVLAARRAPAHLLNAKSRLPRTGPRVAFLAGLGFFLTILFSEYFMMGLGSPAPVAILAMYSLEGLLLAWILRNVGRVRNERVLIALSLGTLMPIAVFGVLAELQLPLTLLADLSMVLFIRALWRRSPPSLREAAG